MRANRSAATTEHERRVWNGWLALFFVVLWFVAAVALFLSVFGLSEEQGVPRVFGTFAMLGFGVFLCFGFFTLQPNEARVLILFGAYKAPCAAAASIGSTRCTHAAAASCRARRQWRSA